MTEGKVMITETEKAPHDMTDKELCALIDMHGKYNHQEYRGKKGGQGASDFSRAGFSLDGDVSPLPVAPAATLSKT